MGTRVGSGRGAVELRETLAGLMTAQSPRDEAARTSSAEERMKSWPSALKGRTNSVTCVNRVSRSCGDACQPIFLS